MGMKTVHGDSAVMVGTVAVVKLISFSAVSHVCTVATVQASAVRLAGAPAGWYSANAAAHRAAPRSVLAA